MTAVLDAETYAKKDSVKLIPGADSAGYDAAANICTSLPAAKMWI